MYNSALSKNYIPVYIPLENTYRITLYILYNTRSQRKYAQVPQQTDFR